MNHTSNREDEIILELLEGDPLAAAVGEDEALRREYVEVLGLLPHALEPVAPSARVRESLMAAVTAPRSTAGSSGGTQLSQPDSARPGKVVRPFVAREAVVAARGPDRWSRWAKIAASVAVLALMASGWLFGQLSKAETRFAVLQDRIDELESREVELADLRERFAYASTNLDMITERGSSACPLRPIGETPLQPVARGVLYVAADHQHWYLKLFGLDAVDETRTYQLWFRTPDGDVPFQSFRTAAGAEVELGSSSMPDGTLAVIVTIEPAEGSGEPSGPVVLFGDERMDLA